jgi:hypothetical protein
MIAMNANGKIILKNLIISSSFLKINIVETYKLNTIRPLKIGIKWLPDTPSIKDIINNIINKKPKYPYHFL